MVPWCSGLTRLPVKEEIGSSNLLGIALMTKQKPQAFSLGLLQLNFKRILRTKTIIESQ